MRANSCWRRPVISHPSKAMRPSLGGKAPDRILKKVLLPAPFGPMIAVRSPLRISSVKLSSARNPSNFMPTPWALRTVSPRIASPLIAAPSPSHPVQQRAPDAARKEQHEEHEQRADEKLPVFGPQ